MNPYAVMREQEHRFRLIAVCVDRDLAEAMARLINETTGDDKRAHIEPWIGQS